MTEPFVISHWLFVFSTWQSWLGRPLAFLRNQKAVSNITRSNQVVGIISLLVID